MGHTWITALVHFVPDGPAVARPAPAARSAAPRGAIAGAGLVARPGEVVETALRCRRRSGRRSPAPVSRGRALTRPSSAFSGVFLSLSGDLVDRAHAVSSARGCVKG